jgi:heme-degrading monooxygenase HmoA
MIVRSWRGRAAVDRAHIYPQHLFDAVLPKLKALPGFCGASLLRRLDGHEIEFVVQTYWESMHAIERFAGARPEVAVVEPAARAALKSFDATVLHYEVVVDANDCAVVLRGSER